MNTKFLSDGRKVSIIGKLNNCEYIVQEVYVDSDGNEVASGEQFTTKKLHDTPLKTYKEKELERVESELKKMIKDSDRYRVECAEEYQKLLSVKALLQQSERLNSLFNEKELDVLTSFMTGTVEYLVLDDYKISPPIHIKDKMFSWVKNSYDGYKKFDYIKILGVCTRSGKTELEYSISDYLFDFDRYKVYPFKTYGDALVFIKNKAEKRIEDTALSNEDFKRCS